MGLLRKSLLIFVIAILIVLSLGSCDFLYKHFGIGNHTHVRHWDDEAEITKEATCFEDGECQWTCYSCGQIITEVISAPGQHTSSEWIADEDNPCTSHTECVVCGEMLETNAEHELSAPVETLAPTLLEPGMSVAKCSKCDYEEMREISPLLIFTLNDDTYSVNASSGARKYDEIIIPDTYKGLKVTEIEDRAFMDFNNVNSIVIGENIEVIGESAFWNCSSLKSINIPSSVKSISEKAFHGCNSLSGVYITDISAWCSIYFEPYISYPDIYYYSNPLSFCDNLYLNGELLTEVIVPDDVSTLEPYVFSSSAIQSVTLGNNVTSICRYAFKDCTSISIITLPSSLKEIESCAFEGCIGIVEVINLSSLDIVAGSTEHGGVARYALSVSNSESKMEAIDDYLFISIDDVNYLVTYNGNDKFLTLPESYNGEKYEIYKNAFSGRSELISITIPNAVTNIGDNAFSDCYRLVEVINHSNLSIREGSTKYGRIGEYAKIIHSLNSSWLTDINGYIFYENNGNVEYIGYNGEETDLILPENCNGTDYTIYEYAFAYQKDVTSVVWPSHLTEIPAEIFQNCSSLKSITIPPSVVKIGLQAFGECFSLENVYITDFETFLNISCDISEYSHDDHPLYYANNLYLNGELLTEVVIPNGIKTIPAFSLSFRFTDITVPGSVKKFEKYAFYECTTIENVYISNIYSWCNITAEGDWSHPLKYGKYLYLNGELIDELVIPSGVVTIPGYAFSCKNITKVTISEGVTKIDSSAFENCEALRSVTLPKSIKSFNSFAFEGCKNIDSVYITDLTSFLSISVEGYSNKLFGCPYDLYLNGVKITDVVIPEGITQIYIQILSYSNIESVSFPKSIKKIYGVLYGNECFTSIYVEDLASWCEVEFDLGSIIERNYDLYVDGMLVNNLQIPEGVTGIGKGIFSYSTITAITVPESLTVIGEFAFYDCDNLKQLSMLNNVSNISNQAFADCNNLEQIILSEKVSYIFNYAFYRCDNLTQVTLTDNVLFIGEEAFGDCIKLTEVSVSKDISTSVEFVPRYEEDVPTVCMLAFSGCEALKKVTFPDRIESIQYGVFNNCVNLEEVILPSKIKQIESDTFSYCNTAIFNEYEGGNYLGNKDNPYAVLIAITDKEQSGYTIHNDTEMISNSVFYGCENLTSIDIPSGVKIIDYFAFSGCTSLVSVAIPESVTSINSGIFSGCTSLRSIVIPESLTFIGNDAFANCTSLTSIIIPESVKQIGSAAFYGCTSLSSVTIPSGIKTIYNYTFYECISLTDVYYTGTNWNNVTIEYGNESLENAKIYMV